MAEKPRGKASQWGMKELLPASGACRLTCKARLDACLEVEVESNASAPALFLSKSRLIADTCGSAFMILICSCHLLDSTEADKKTVFQYVN